MGGYSTVLQMLGNFIPHIRGLKSAQTQMKKSSTFLRGKGPKEKVILKYHDVTKVETSPQIF